MSIKIKTFPQIYIGESINPKQLFFIKNKIKHAKGKYFIIIPSDSENELLDIIEAKYLGLPIYKNKEFVIGGIAASMSEAHNLVKDMTVDCQRKRGDLNLKEFILCGRYY